MQIYRWDDHGKASNTFFPLWSIFLPLPLLCEDNCDIIFKMILIGSHRIIGTVIIALVVFVIIIIAFIMMISL